jgi:hypothetical protein
MFLRLIRCSFVRPVHSLPIFPITLNFWAFWPNSSQLMLQMWMGTRQIRPISQQKISGAVPIMYFRVWISGQPSLSQPYVIKKVKLIRWAEIPLKT